MDMNQITQALSLSLSNKEQERKASAEIILHARELSGFGPLMLQIAIGGANIPFPIQQNAAIQLKNLVCKNWKYGSNHEVNLSMRFEEDEKIIVISEQDKTHIRNNIFEAFLQINNKLIRKQICECIKKIAKFELSNKFSFVIDNIIKSFASGEDNKIFAGIIIFYNIAKLYSFETGDYKIPYTDAFNKMHDYLMNFIVHLIDNFDNPEACYIIYKIIKIYFLSTQTDLNDFVTYPINLEKWMNVLLFILEKKYSNELVKITENSEDQKHLEKNIYWKIKLYAMKIFNFSYYRHSHKSKNKDSKIKEYSNLITNTYTEKFFNSYIAILHSSKDQYIPDPLGGQIYKFIADLVSKNHLIPQIEQLMENILNEHIIRSSFIKKGHIDLWKHDMKTYILHEFDVTEYYDTEREGAVKFLKELSTYRRRVNKKKEKYPAYFESIYKFLVAVLETYENQVKTGNHPDFRIKEATLFLIENLEEEISKYSGAYIEKMLELFVIHEISGSNPFIRNRAIMVMNAFKFFQFKNIENVKAISEKLFKAISDSDLSTKVCACICAPGYFSHKDIQPILDQHVSSILTIFINILNEIELEELLVSLEAIIEIFNEKCKDFSIDLTKILVERFMYLIQVDEDNQVKSNNNFIIMEGIIKTILCIIGIFSKFPDVFPAIFENIKKIIDYGFTEEGFEKLEDSLDMIISIVKNENNVFYPQAWEFFVALIESVVGTEKENSEIKQKYQDQIFMGNGYEELKNVTHAILLYIVRDNDTFLKGVQGNPLFYVSKIIELVQKIVNYAIASNEHHQIKYAYKLINGIMESSKGKIDNIMPDIIDYLISEIKSSKKNEHKQALIEFCASVFIYNPELTMKVLEAKHFVEEIFNFWLPKLDSLNFQNQKNKSLMAFVSILSINPANQNQTVKANINHIINSMISLTKIYKTKSNNANKDKNDNSDEEEEIDDEENTNKFNFDDLDNEDFEDDEIDDEDGEWDELDQINNITIIEKQNPILYLRDGFTFIQNTYPEYYNNLLSLIGTEGMGLLDSKIKESEKN